MKSPLIEDLALYRYRYRISYALLILAPLVLLFVLLGGLTPGLNELEARSALQSNDIVGLINNPVNFSYRLVQYLSVLTLGPTVFAVRLPSVIFGILLLAGMYKLFQIWHQPRIAIIGTLFIAASSWFLNFARFGTPAISVATMLVAVLLTTAWFHHTETKDTKALLLLGGVIALALYTPLVVYFIAIAMLSHYKLVWKHIKKVDNQHLMWGGLFLALLIAPLLYASVTTPGVAREILGLPARIPSLTDVMLNSLSAFGGVFWRSEAFPPLHLGTLAMLEIFTASMTALGLYHYERHYDHHRTRLLMIGFFAILLAIGLSGSPTLMIALLPFVYIFAATGVITMLTQWYTIFPINPVARTVAIIPLGLVLLVTAYYHTNRYFVAWARAPETKAAFSADAQVLRQSILSIPQAEAGVYVITKDEERVEFALSNLEDSRYITIKQPEESALNDYSGIDVLYVAADTGLATDIKTQLNKQPKRLTTGSSKNPVAYYRFDLVTP